MINHDNAMVRLRCDQIDGTGECLNNKSLDGFENGMMNGWLSRHSSDGHAGIRGLLIWTVSRSLEDWLPVINDNVASIVSLIGKRSPDPGMCETHSFLRSSPGNSINGHFNQIPKTLIISHPKFVQRNSVWWMQLWAINMNIIITWNKRSNGTHQQQSSDPSQPAC